MRKIVALGCAASALAIASTAYAQSNAGVVSKGDGYSVDIQGKVPGFCTITGPVTLNVSNGQFAPNGDKRGLIKIDQLGDVNGNLQAAGASGTIQIVANEACKLSLVSSKGGLENQDNPNANKISYSAVVYNESSDKTLVQVKGPGEEFSGFTSKFDPTTLGNDTINFQFKITEGGVVAAGNYIDTLTLNVKPTI